MQVDLDEGLLRKLAYTARGELNAMAAMFGGIVGQEVGILENLIPAVSEVSDTVDHVALAMCSHSA